MANYFFNNLPQINKILVVLGRHNEYLITELSEIGQIINNRENNK